MRLFTAILLGEGAGAELENAVSYLRERAVRGSFSQPGNLHLTLVFLGEAESPDAARRALRRVEGAPFSLVLGGFGSFPKPDGEICWIGVERSGELTALHRRLCAELCREGFPAESRRYTPHLTVARRVVLPEGFDREAFSKRIPRLEMRVGRVSLMRSERVAGELRYMEIDFKELEESR